MTDLSILMPVFNERETVEQAIDEALGASYPVDAIELVVVDDGSTDGSRELLQDRAADPRVRLILHERNGGKGAAVRTALDHATGRWAAIMDADLEYNPEDLAHLLEPLIEGEAEVVFGTRGFEAHSAFSFWYVMGNKGVTLVANVLFNAWLADIMTCQKVMPTQVMKALQLSTSGFTIEPEITGKLLSTGYQIYEMPIRYHARAREEGKKLTALDGIRVVWTLLRVRLAAGRLPGRTRHHR